MSQILKTEPAYAADPGTTVTGDGVIISAVFHGSEPCGVILYHIPDGRSVKVPFSDDFRFGSLYSVKISPLDTSAWCYRLYKGENEFVDPCCRSLVRAEALNRAGNESFLAGGFFCEPDDRLPAYRPVRTGSDEGFIYSLHVKGFTMLAESLASVPGTFSAAAEKAAYLRDLGESQLLGIRERVLLCAQGGLQHAGLRRRPAEGILRYGTRIPRCRDPRVPAAVFPRIGILQDPGGYSEVLCHPL